MADAPSIIVVEDEYLLHAMLEDALTDGGFASVFVASGEEAAALLNSEGTDYKALVTDVHVSGHLNGWTLARLVRQSNPDLPVVYMTGAHGDEWASEGVPNSILVLKPFAPAQLVTAVSQLLNKVANP
jgi:DNA-binding response OmpR family regulator